MRLVGWISLVTCLNDYEVELVGYGDKVIRQDLRQFVTNHELLKSYPTKTINYLTSFVTSPISVTCNIAGHLSLKETERTIIIPK